MILRFTALIFSTLSRGQRRKITATHTEAYRKVAKSLVVWSDARTGNEGIQIRLMPCSPIGRLSAAEKPDGPCGVAIEWRENYRKGM